MKRWALFLAMLLSVPFVLPTISAYAWPRAGIAVHYSHGPALNREPVAEQGAKIDVPRNSKNVEGFPIQFSRESVETGNLPESSQPRSSVDKIMEDRNKADRHYTNVGP